MPYFRHIFKPNFLINTTHINLPLFFFFFFFVLTVFYRFSGIFFYFSFSQKRHLLAWFEKIYCNFFRKRFLQLNTPPLKLSLEAWTWVPLIIVFFTISTGGNQVSFFNVLSCWFLSFLSNVFACTHFCRYLFIWEIFNDSKTKTKIRHTIHTIR